MISEMDFGMANKRKKLFFYTKTYVLYAQKNVCDSIALEKTFFSAEY